MIRITKICCYLNRYIETRSLDAYQRESHQGLRLGILNGEQKEFVKYLQQQKSFASDSEIKLFDEIKDAKKDDYLETAIVDVFGYKQDVLRLGLRGRKLVNGSFINRWVYFITYAYEDTPWFYPFIIGVVLTTIAKFIWELLGF